MGQSILLPPPVYILWGPLFPPTKFYGDRLPLTKKFYDNWFPTLLPYKILWQVPLPTTEFDREFLPVLKNSIVTPSPPTGLLGEFLLLVKRFYDDPSQRSRSYKAL